MPSSEVWGGDSVRIKDDSKFVDVMALNNGIYEDESDEYYAIFSEQTEFSFVVSRRNIENISGGMNFGVYNMYVRSAVLQAYDPAELEPGKDAVLVDIDSHANGSLSGFIPLDTIRSFDSDVKITLDIEYEKMETDTDNLGAFIIACSSDWRELAIEVENIYPSPWWEENDHAYELGSKNFPDKFTFTLPKREIKKLDENGLCFHSNNLHIKTAAVESASITVDLDLVYAGAYNYSNEIPKSVLDKFDGDVKITLDLDKYNDVQNDDGLYNGLIEPVDIAKSVRVNVPNMTVSGGTNVERGKMYQLGYDADKFVFVITKETIDSLYSGKLRFKVVNLKVNSATLERYYPEELEPGSDAKLIELDDTYPGDWGGGETIPKSTLEAFGGDVRVTLNIKEAAPSRSPDDYVDQKLWFCPISVNEDWSWDGLSVIGDNLNSYSPEATACCLGMREQAVPVPEVITFVLPQSEIAKMGQGMLFQTCCLYVTSAYLEKA